MSCDRQSVSISSRKLRCRLPIVYDVYMSMLLFVTTMMKRTRSRSPLAVSKKGRTGTCSPFAPIKIATAEAAATVQTEPPFLRLLDALRDVAQKPSKGQSIVYWMRMGDLRSRCCFFSTCVSILTPRFQFPIIKLSPSRLLRQSKITSRSWFCMS